MPAMAPPLRPLFVVVVVIPAALLAPVAEAEAEGVWKGTVVVTEPVDVTVVAALLVGRMNAVAVDGAASVAVIDAK